VAGRDVGWRSGGMFDKVMRPAISAENL